MTSQPPEFILRTVAFAPNGDVEINFVRSADLKTNGLLLSGSLYVPADADYGEEIEAVQNAVLFLLADAMEDHGRLPMMPLTEDEPDDEDDDDE